MVPFFKPIFRNIFFAALSHECPREIQIDQDQEEIRAERQHLQQSDRFFGENVVIRADGFRARGGIHGGIGTQEDHKNRGDHADGIFQRLQPAQREMKYREDGKNDHAEHIYVIGGAQPCLDTDRRVEEPVRNGLAAFLNILPAAGSDYLAFDFPMVFAVKEPA